MMADADRMEENIRTLCKELQLAYANTMAAYVTECFLQKLSESAYASRLWIRGGSRYQLPYYRRKIDLSLEFYDTKPQQGTEEEVRQMLQSICMQEKDPDPGLYWEITKKQNWVVTAVTGSRNIPLSIHLSALTGCAQNPVQVTLPLCTKPDTQIRLWQYPPEERLTEGLAEILKNLELIHDMRTYEEVWQLLCSESVDGRKIQQQLMTRLGEDKILPDKKRMELFYSYLEYPYMKKRWKALLKRENKKEPSWEEVMTKLLAFLQPVWDMMQQDMIFIGDWMPELGRFL